MALDDFDRAWQETFIQFQPQIALTTALFQLTGLGDHRIEIEQLAAAIGRSPDETAALARQWARVRVEDGCISFDPQSSPFSRYHVAVGARVMDVGGCAVDLFWAALAAGVAFRAESRCPATGMVVGVDLSPDGIELVEPSGAVVAVLHPQAPVLQEMSNVETADADVCSEQPFFASAEAAASWLAAHPGGRIYSVAEFFTWFHRNLAMVSASV
jgi:alkylmercury lyase